MKRMALLSLSRFGTTTATMTFAACLPWVVSAWGLSASQAGVIQSAYNISYAVSLLVSSALADSFGAKRVFLLSAFATAAAFAIFAVFARSYETAAMLFAIVGLAQGGTYTPSIMLASQHSPVEKRGRAIGWLQAAASMGYLASIVLVVAISKSHGYELSLAIVAVGPMLGAIAGWLALSNAPNVVHHDRRLRRPTVKLSSFASPVSLLLTIGYAAHAWEVLGMWAWMPTFLSHSLDITDGSAITQAILIAVPTHLSGVAATLFMGEASDRWGRRRILIGTALIGGVLSCTIGWAFGTSPYLLLPLVFIYCFALVGDSGVLSTAMTEVADERILGNLLGLRSILGFGAGAISPILFGWILDQTNTLPAPQMWGLAFASLGIGGLIAAACAAMLPKTLDRSNGTRC